MLQAQHKCTKAAQPVADLGIQLCGSKHLGKEAQKSWLGNRNESEQQERSMNERDGGIGKAVICKRANN